jgi:hypothetical protein
MSSVWGTCVRKVRLVTGRTDANTRALEGSAGPHLALCLRIPDASRCNADCRRSRGAGARDGGAWPSAP